MALEFWLTIAPILLLLSFGPGPNNFTSMYNGIRVGAMSAVIAVIGRNIAFIILMIISALGLGAVIVSSSFWFNVVKWLGVVYLLYIGVKTWLAAKDSLHTMEEDGVVVPSSHYSRMRQEFMIAISNPKAVLIFTAIFPQLLDLSKPVAIQFTVIGATFVVTEFIAAFFYAIGGRQLRKMIRSPKGLANLNRGMGSIFVAASVFLATATR
ncbi:LysE family translocator [Marinomonas fungiae]|uniref:Threonine/homoserine/homoserine lactone efflux protein n=1 Tax=Marinomonas fungiae TaxID=1137284 RepID=A0A0K6IJ65_9GAMM|nr:LysE family translocator [Marinomonas fungiae]CUB03145.1 Threonine/homoserine/homoserine lactone efflux protein [Marinomonas fungiae]